MQINLKNKKKYLMNSEINFVRLNYGQLRLSLLKILYSEDFA